MHGSISLVHAKGSMRIWQTKNKYFFQNLIGVRHENLIKVT